MPVAMVATVVMDGVRPSPACLAVRRVRVVTVPRRLRAWRVMAVPAEMVGPEQPVHRAR